MKNILLVEDEASVVNFIRRGLSEENYAVSVAFTGASGIKMALEHPFDLIILDIMLPDRNGLDLCRELRARQLQTPILFLTALGTSENVAVGLNYGADDYLVKPFKFIELSARINALIRRANRAGELEGMDQRGLGAGFHRGLLRRDVWISADDLPADAGFRPRCCRPKRQFVVELVRD